MQLQNKVIIVTGEVQQVSAKQLPCDVKRRARVIVHGLEKHWGEAVVAEAGDDKAILHVKTLLLKLPCKGLWKLPSGILNLMRW